MSNDTTGVIDSRKDYKNTPRGQYDFWMEELKSSEHARKHWHKQGDEVVKRFLDSRKSVISRNDMSGSPFKLNLFHSNITTLTSMLYGNVPQIDVSRRYADPNDDVSRVAAEIMERMLNNDVAENGEEISCVLRSTLQDRLLPGLGCARVRYEVETEMVENELGIEEERLVTESAPVDYFFWRDVLWGWGRNWAEIPWIAYRIYLTKDEVEEAFGKEAAKDLDYKKQLVENKESSAEDPVMTSPWNKAEIWEIWDKVKRKVVFVSKGHSKVLDTKDDPLQLSGFYPSPPFFIANVTTTLYTPVPDYHMAQDLYSEIDKLQTRITILTQAVKAVGVYDAGNDEIKRVFQEGTDNQLIPVKNWGMFAEKGGMAGQIDWVPLTDITNALDKLRELRNETIDLLYQVTGMADVMRGGGAGQYEGVGQVQMKAKMSSVRIQALQDEFATFASDLMQLKAEIISIHFSPETIVERSNIDKSYDQQYIPQALELIKNPRMARLKVKIRPESVAMVDYAQLKSERTEYINALSTFFQSAAPIIEQDKAMKPFLLTLLQWGLAGFKGSSEIEGVVDKAIDAAEKAAQESEGKPDPEKQRMDMAMKMEQMKGQNKLAEIQAKAQADSQTRQQDLQADMESTMASHQAKLAEIDADMQATLAETQAKMEADIAVEQVQAQANIQQTISAAEGEIQKDALGTQMEVEKEVVKTNLKIQEIAAATSGKIKEAQARPTEGKSDA